MNSKQKIFALILISSFTLLLITIYGLGWNGNYIKKNELYDSQLKDHVKKSVKDIRRMWSGDESFYKAVSQVYNNIGSLDEFLTKMKDKGKTRLLYDQLIKDGYTHIGEYSAFNQKILSKNIITNQITFHLNYLKSNDFDVYTQFKKDNENNDIVSKIEENEPKEYYRAFKFSKILNTQYIGINWLGIISILGIVASLAGFYLFKD